MAAAGERGPSDEQLRALSAGVFAGLGISAIATTAGVATGSAKSALVAVTHGWWAATAAKVAVGVALAGAVTGGGVVASRWHPQSTLAPSSAVTTARSAPRPATTPIADEPILVASPDPGPAIQAASTETAAPPYPVGTSARRKADGAARGHAQPPPRDERDRPSKTKVSSAALAEPVRSDRELVLLARARAALASDPGLALAVANTHGRLFPLGLLNQERDVVIIEALVGLGRRRQALEHAERFARQYPHSPYARKIASVLPETAPIEQAPGNPVDRNERLPPSRVGGRP